MVTTSALTYDERLEALRQTKLAHTRAKQAEGAWDNDDHGRILPPVGFDFTPMPNHPSGGFFGARAVGANFRAMLEAHPVYVDPNASLAGGYMTYFMKLREPHWNPDLDYSHLHANQKRYGIIPGIGGSQHFAPDLRIGFSLGWGGLLAKIHHFREVNAENPDSEPGIYDGLTDVIRGTQDWMRRTVAECRRLAESESRPELRQNLVELAEMNEYLVAGAPRTFREACQWLCWFQMIARMFNGSGALDQLDERLRPFYEADVAAGCLTDEEAIFHIACTLVNDSQYSQLGGPGADGRDQTTRVSYLILDAAHRLKIPTNLAVRVWDGMDPEFFKLAVRYLVEDKVGAPLFMGDKGLSEGFVRNGYPLSLARERVKVGCHWCAIPGREYTLNDVVKINFASVFEYALKEMIAENPDPTTTDLWDRFVSHLKIGVATVADGEAFHLAHMWEVYPELVLDLLCCGPVEKGRDASHGGVEFYNMCVDGTALATVADSFAAIEQRVEREGKLTWAELMRLLETDFAGAEDARLMLKGIPRYGSGGSRADEYATRISKTFAAIVKDEEKGRPFKLIPGLFSWANTIGMGQIVGATPNGRHAHAPIAHGANPDPGFTGAGAPTAMAVAIAAVQPGYGNTAPLQLELDPGLANDAEGIAAVEALIRGHVALGGTQMNLNVLNTERVLEAHADPSKYPDLVVRVTGFSAYFASLSQEFRQLVVDRLISGM
jgi:pyruvate-formate lyase